eukprot:9482030-Pyramimonas_sp.AAC.2
MPVARDCIPSYASREAMIRSLDYLIPNVPDNAERRARIVGSFVWSPNSPAKFVAADGESDASINARKIKIVKYNGRFASPPAPPLSETSFSELP